jgi:predicted RNA-binding Zn-ribbon protein involved in translation (DUF1610 family)
VVPAVIENEAEGQRYYHISNNASPRRLKPCRSCNREISKKADECPHCGYRYVTSFARRLHRTNRVVAWIIGIILVGILVRAFL